MDEMSFAGKVAIVTGAGRGIGRAEAMLLADRGAAVVVCDPGGTMQGRPSGEDPAGETVALIRAAGGTATASRETVATPEGAAAIVDTAVREFGGLDAVVNNAGIFGVAEFEDVTDEDLRAQLAVHFFGSVHVSRAAWRLLKATGAGRIVNTVSAAMLGVPGMVHYGSAKGAVFGLTRNLAVAGAPHGIRVNALAPGAATRMVEATGDSLPDGFAEHMRKTMPPSLVAPVCAYLAHESCTVSGEILATSGGSVHRLAIVKTVGVRSDALTPEVVRDRIDEILDTEDAAVRELLQRPAVAAG